MSNAYFQFKHFTVWHDRCAMKVGTDGVLVGALAPSQGFKRILDVGTGSGLIALMMAQRCPDAEITAIEIDESAASQAKENFASSPWNERIHLVLSDFNEYETDEPFDLIVSNPPYFADALKNPDPQRSVARHNDTLNYYQLFLQARKLLQKSGLCCLIIPTEMADFVNEMGARNHFFPKAVTHIFTKPGKPCRRLFITYWRGDDYDLYYPDKLQENTLYLMDADGKYSTEYRLLTKDFYIKL
ncbi:MAG: methyltransferase [Bacteroidaceae bacterium]|nr:methyltransferase [Bacteroidaceae bacterium]